MSLFQKLFGEKLTPYFPEYVSDNAEDELKKASSAEQYRIGEHLLFIPRGLKWSYVPFDKVTDAVLSHWIYQPRC